MCLGLVIEVVIYCAVHVDCQHPYHMVSYTLL